jgi:hypothetical protein
MRDTRKVKNLVIAEVMSAVMLMRMLKQNALARCLWDIIEALRGMPEAIAQPLIESTDETASRLAANVSMERAPFVAAVQAGAECACHALSEDSGIFV